MKLKHFFLIGGFLFVFSPLAHAQGREVAKALLNAGRVETTLLKRVESSYNLARRAQYLTRPTFLTPGPRRGELILPAAFPTRAITPSLHFANPSEVYPDAPFLTTDQQVESYLVSRNNRAISQELKHLADHSEKIADNMATFRQEANLCEQPTQQIPWLLNRIDSNINYLFVGELHHAPEVRLAMSQLLQGLQQKFPRREIIVLTEFLPNDISTQEVWEAAFQQPTLEDRMELLGEFENLGEERLSGGVWGTLRDRQIQVVGLEPNFVWENAQATLVPQDPSDTPNLNLWWTDEGDRIRHEHWMRRILTWRQQHPDSLFVIYGGAGHFSYFRSPAISNHFPREQRLVINLFPQKYRVQDANNNIFELKDNLGWFAEITQNQFPQHTLYWRTEQSAMLSGFDYQLRVPALR